MKQRFDLSVGQRLALGFVVVVLVLAVFVAILSSWHRHSIAVQEEVEGRILPFVESIHAVERALLGVSVATRTYLLSPEKDTLERYRRAVERATAAVRRLAEHPKDAQTAARFADVAPTIERFLLEAEQLIARRERGPLTAADEEAMTVARSVAVAGLEALADAQDQELRTALMAMADARKVISEGLLGASLLTALLLVVTGYLTVRSVQRPTRQLMRVAAALEAGDWRPALAWAPPPESAGGTQAHAHARNEIVRLGRAFGAAARALESRERRLRAKREVAAAAASSLKREELAHAVLAAIAAYAHAEVGVVYWRDKESGRLVPIARLGIHGEAQPVPIGEGVPGRAAEEGRPVVLRGIPRDTPFLVRLGYDEAPPRTVAAYPVTFGGEQLGVVLLASLRDLDEETLSFVRSAALQLGIGLENAHMHEEAQRLLAEVRERNERIQAQNEELQAQNEEIQAQSEEIQAQSEEIQAQNEELKRHAEELQVQARNLAEAGRRQSEFLGVLAHELRNPLAAITNSLVIAKRTPAGSEQSLRAQAVIERQAQQLIRLIDDLLDLTRISQGRIRIQRERIDLNEVVRACIEDQTAAFDGEEPVIELDLPEEEVVVEGDRARLCQVLGNLLHNAIKFTDPDGWIRVAVRPDARAGRVAVHVIDTGIGIDPEFLPQLFRPFNQGPAGAHRSGAGLGLGLALVKELTELHGGSVEARSAGEGKGAEFIVRLPLLQAPAEHPAPTETSVRARRVLLVEDNVDVAYTLRDLLELEGHRVEVAHSGREALERARAFLPDVVLCDIGLPGMDGYEVAQRLREERGAEAPLLVALTGFASNIDKERAARAGFDHHLAKPPSIERLRDLIGALA
ncbi:MAG TPA: ATP-binding protein [Burkholderiales bacterium]